MSATSASLLDRLRSNPAEADWQRLVDIYTPLIRNWLQRHGLPKQESADLVQEVLAVVVRRISDFEHNKRVGAFRNWLRTIAVNCSRDWWKKQKNRPAATGGSDFQEMLAELEDPDSDLSQTWNLEHDQHVMKYLLKQIQAGFEAKTWQAFQRVSMDGISAAKAAGELGITTNAVFIAKSRVLARLREEAGELLD